MPEFAVLYDPDYKRWLRFQNPLERIEVHDPSQVLPALQHIECLVEERGLYAAGFVSYEAASAFDDALRTRAADGFPLLSFGIFPSIERVDLAPQSQEGPVQAWRASMAEPAFSGKVEDVRAAIARGETYQVNLTFQLLNQGMDDPWSFFCRLVHGQRAPGAGYLDTGDWTICSASPELFFSRDAGQLTMRPMKGTAPRGRSSEEDRQRAEELSLSVKNRAENIMILDMVRNDLGRLAPPGEVRTTGVCTLEKYPTVWQLTSTAVARSDASCAEIFRALFPCASITGAPKVQTMRIIAALENAPRRIYTGAFGWMAPGRQARFNVAIRTALIDRRTGSASYGVGAGITWDSEGVEEYRECLLKGEVLSQPSEEFALIETLRWSPGKGYFLLPEHLHRLAASADYFDFLYSREQTIACLEERADSFSNRPQKVRLLLYADGRTECSSAAIDTVGSTQPARISLARQAIDSRNRLLYHKTTRRQIYERALADAQDADEVILWNERGEVTEGCRANLVVACDGQLLTPPVTSGLLPGTYRAYLLQRGVIKEKILTVNDLRRASQIYLINAVRKWRKAVLCSE